MNDDQRRAYYARLRGQALGIEGEAKELAELLAVLIAKPGTSIEEMPLDLSAWFPSRSNTLEHIRSEVILMAATNAPRQGLRQRLRKALRR